VSCLGIQQRGREQAWTLRRKSLSKLVWSAEALEWLCHASAPFAEGKLIMPTSYLFE